MQLATEPEPEPDPTPTFELVSSKRQHRYCWEYKGNGTVLEGCRSCVVYELRAQRCYEVLKLAPELRHSKLFCEGSCEECDYYQRVHAQSRNVLVVTDDAQLVDSLQHDSERGAFNLQFTDCEYTCSALVETFRPDYAVLDCSLGPQATWAICSHLSADPRIPFVRVILAGDRQQYPEDCEHMVFAHITKGFSMRDLAACAAGALPEGMTSHLHQSDTRRLESP